MPLLRGYYRDATGSKNLFARPKRFRRVAIRYDKLAGRFIASCSSRLSWIGSLIKFENTS